MTELGFKMRPLWVATLQKEPVTGGSNFGFIQENILASFYREASNRESSLLDKANKGMRDDKTENHHYVIPNEIIDQS